MTIKLYRGSMVDESIGILGSWYSTSFNTACRYCHRVGYVAIVEVELVEEEEGKYLLTKTVEQKGHSNSWGQWERGSYEKWYYISPVYLNKCVKTVTVVNLLGEAVDSTQSAIQ